MHTKTQAVPRSGSHWRLPVVLGAVLVMAALASVGCTPDVPQQPVPTFLELEFDPSASPPLAYQPTLLVTNQTTGLLDFSLAGMNIPTDPADCQTQTDMPVAACEFYWYLQQLDGFPTLTPLNTPVITHAAGDALAKTPVDVATVTLPENLFVYEFLHGKSPVTAGTVAYDADEVALTFDPAAGWDIGGLYLVAVRGYANGIKDTDGNEAVKSLIYVLLAQDSSLTCGATSADAIDENCEYYTLFASDARFNTLPPDQMKAAIGATLLQLEELREVYKGQSGLPINVWDQVADPAMGNMPADEVGILWAFRTHTASVVELNPTKGLMPTTPSGTEVRVKAKGPIDESSLTAFGFADLHGSIFLLDATEFGAPNPDLTKSIPAFAPTYDSATGEIVLTLTDVTLPLVDQHQYILLVTDLVMGKPGVPIVPSPVTVFLRTRGSLVDSFDNCSTDPITATPQVPGLKAPDACQLEAGRQQFAGLLDNPSIQTFTAAFGPNGLTREMVMYMYGFQYTAQ